MNKEEGRKKVKKLAVSFFGKSPVIVAEKLLGKFLVRKHAGKGIAYMITETEAYSGEEDLACHASKGRTIRTETLYGEPAHFYIYLCYGMHYMLNIVTSSKGHPSAVLIRALEGIVGPGRVTKSLEISKNLNGKEASAKSGYWFEDRGVKIDKKSILKTSRIGVEYAGPVWSKKPWRFIVDTT